MRIIDYGMYYQADTGFYFAYKFCHYKKGLVLKASRVREHVALRVDGSRNWHKHEICLMAGCGVEIPVSNEIEAYAMLELLD